MAPTDPTNLLGKRYTCDRYGNCGNNWYWYGRWIFAAVVIALIILIFFLWACVNSRRRRKRGMQPMYGTGWMASHNQHQNNPNAYNSAPPAYGAPPGQSYPMQNQYTGNTFQPQDGYYGQREGVQQPKDAHTHNNDYAPPAGPPPGKTTY
ncbi:hypothetical protein AB5N19_05271 [Seiridium cardinale]